MNVEVEINHPKKSLEIIIPFRWTNKRPDLYERIKFPYMDSLLPDDVGITISDDGSPLNVKIEISQICRKMGINYIYTPSEYSPVCMSRARNNAVINIDSDYIFFQDADLMPYKGFYHDALREIDAQRIRDDSANFLMFGVVYLTKEATQEFLNTSEDHRKNIFLQYFLEDDKTKVEKFSTGTSVTLFHRHYYLSRGGYDEDFVEWGYEDLEFNLRCIRALKKFPLPSNISKDIGTFRSIDKYEGWKSLYRLFGDLTFNKGILMFHAWHEIDHDSTYMKKKAVNGELFLKKMKNFASLALEPEVLPMRDRGKTLCFSSTNPFIFNRKTAPFLGNLIVRDEKDFDEKGIIDFIIKNNIDRILFHNPYANQHRLIIFNAVKDSGFPYLIAERGALRDSVFFDDTGFNADSTRYKYEYWSDDLNATQLDQVKSYIINEKGLNESLELQSNRIGSEALRRKLKIPKSKKVIFVPLQRPSDTVIQFFTKELGGYDNFLEIVCQAAEILKNDYVFVLKKHPLEDKTRILDNLIYADDANIKDLLELASVVYLINSGVGILAMMYEKQVIVAGEAFYGAKELVSKACSVTELIASIRRGDNSSTKMKMQFINYLISNFYSFGKFETRVIPWTDGGNMTVTSKIDFYQINIPGLAKSKYVLDRELFKRSSIIFDRYKAPVASKPTTSAVVPVVLLNKTDAVEILDSVASEKSAESSLSKENDNIERFKKKVVKLNNNPRSFYLESKNSLVRKIGNILGYQE